VTTAQQAVDWLRGEVENGSIHTIRLSFSDHLGAWRGKRIPAQHFLEKHLDEPMGFCDGMIVCDVQCDIIQATPYSNFATGYPDFHVWADLPGLRRATWVPGEAFVFGDPADHHQTPFGVAPRQVLRRVLANLTALGIDATTSVRIGGRLMRDPHTGIEVGRGGLSPTEDMGPIDHALRGVMDAGYPVATLEAGTAAGEFEIGLGPGHPFEIAEAVVVTKGACKELARAEDMTSTFMTLTPGGSRPSLLEIVVHTSSEIAQLNLGSRILEARGLLQPSITAFKAGTPKEPIVVAEDDGRRRTGPFEASSEADPFAALAIAMAAVGDAASASSPGRTTPPEDLTQAASTLGASQWAREWLGDAYVDNSVPLLLHEAGLMDDVVTDWELERYWSAS
jgi:glutamine synthetase